ncbi:MAG: ATP-grasp domain-containing protein [bacterium]
MKVGITYDLRQDYLDEGYSLEETAEFDKLDTINGIDNALKELGYETERIGNVKSLIKKVADGQKWDIVFNIAEGMYGIAREAQIPSILDAYQIPYTFSDAFMLNICLHKGITKSLVKSLGLNTPDYYVLDKEENIKNIDLPFPLFAKPVAEGTGKGINALSKIKTQEELEKICKNLLTTYKQPVLIETFLPGREFTVGIVGTGKESKALAVMEIILNEKAEQDVYSYNNKENYEDLVSYTIVEGEVAEKCKKLALDSWAGLNLRDGGRIDIRFDQNNEPAFIEVNPLAGLNYQTSDLPIMCSKVGISFTQLIDMIMKSALQRLNNGK